MLLHLKYRWLRWRMWVVMYVIIATMACFSDVHTTQYRSYPVFEQWYAQKRGMVFACIILIYLCLQLFLIYRDDHGIQRRRLLLPQKRSVQVYGDLVFLVIVMLVLTLGYAMMYVLSFRSYVAILDEKDIMLFQQTRDVWVSMQHCPVISWLLFESIPEALLNICLCLLGAEIVVLISSLCTKGNQPMWKYLTASWLVIMIGVIIIVLMSVWITLCCVIILCIGVWYLNLHICNKREIGG